MKFLLSLSLIAASLVSQNAFAETWVFDRLWSHGGPYPYKTLLANGVNANTGYLQCKVGIKRTPNGSQYFANLYLLVNTENPPQLLTFTRYYASDEECSEVREKLMDAVYSSREVSFETSGSKIISLSY